MADYSLSVKGTIDISGLYEYGIEKFGFSQAQTYLLGLEKCLQDLAQNPKRGRRVKVFKKEYLMNYRYVSHVIFYTPTYAGIFVVRVLGKRMDFKRHL